ncbi:MAG: GspMb/PilO family protein [Sedimentisphaerales bacterium]|jgi:hypothetical protein
MLANNLSKLSPSSRTALSASLILIAVIAMYNWMVAPRASYLSAAERYGSTMENVIGKNKVVETRVRVRRKKVKELQEQAAQLQNALFMPDKAREFFSDLQAIAEETGCSVYSVNLVDSKQNAQPGLSEDTAGIVVKSTILSVAGSYKNITQLIHRLQSRAERVWIDRINLRTVDYDLDQPRCDITITICTFADKEQA